MLVREGGTRLLEGRVLSVLVVGKISSVVVDKRVEYKTLRCGYLVETSLNKHLLRNLRGKNQVPLHTYFSSRCSEMNSPLGVSTTFHELAFQIVRYLSAWHFAESVNDKVSGIMCMNVRSCHYPRSLSYTCRCSRFDKSQLKISLYCSTTS